jgi:hypothetical protein
MIENIYYLAPGLSESSFCGGLLAIQRMVDISNKIKPTHIVTYREKHKNVFFLDTLLNKASCRNCLFISSWGPDIRTLIKKLANYCHAYFAHSTGYEMILKKNIPILCISRFTMGKITEKYTNAPIMLQPNVIDAQFQNKNIARDIDILALKRKSSPYLLALLEKPSKTHNVFILDKKIDDIAGLFNRSWIYLYGAIDFWAQHKLTEGFALQPLEALACGCHVFSTLHHALSDYLTPYQNCIPISGDPILDIREIESVLHSQSTPNNDIVKAFREPSVLYSLEKNYKIIEDYFELRSNKLD